jgi:hypothetical protein
VLLLFLAITAVNTTFMTISNLSPTDYPGCSTKYHLHSVEAHFQDGVGSGSLIVFIQQAANNFKNDKDVPTSVLCD